MYTVVELSPAIDLAVITCAIRSVGTAGVPWKAPVSLSRSTPAGGGGSIKYVIGPEPLANTMMGDNGSP